MSMFNTQLARFLAAAWCHLHLLPLLAVMSMLWRAADALG